MKKLSFNCHDFAMFDGELNAYEYEFFYKHTGAFKRLMKDEPKEQKQKFLDAFCEFFLNHGEMNALSTAADHKKKFVENFRTYAQETFIDGKFSTAKQFLNDAVIVAKNKHLVQNMELQSYAKDPFFNRETRDVFRRLFGQPNEAGTCVKVICLLPMYVKFAGSICRYLRVWLDADEAETSALAKSGGKPQKMKKKEEEAKSNLNDAPGFMMFKGDGEGLQAQIRQVNEPKYLMAGGVPWPQMVEQRKEKKCLQRNDDIDRNLRRFKREERMNRESEKLKERRQEAENKRLKKEKMDEAKRSVVGSKETEKINSWKEFRVKNVGSVNSESKDLERTTSEDKIPEGKIPEGKIPEGEIPEVEIPEVEIPKVEIPKVEIPEGEISEGEMPEGIIPGNKTAGGKTAEGKTAEDKTAEGQIPAGEVPEEKMAEEKKLEGQPSEEENLSENELSIDIDSSDSNAAEDVCIKETFPGLHLGEPHPNKVYDNMVKEEREEKERSKSNSWKAHCATKLRNCAFCRNMEHRPKAFKKCQRCKGKGTKFYCCRGCQKNDWPNHRLEHENSE